MIVGDYKRGTQNEEVKVALVHTAIRWKDREGNLTKLLSLNEEAAGKGARIILNAELATCGYAFESRNGIAPFTETIPGPATGAFGQISKKYGCYICVGLPEVDTGTGMFYNAAALVGPDGHVLGKTRKLSPVFRENLWAAKGNLPVLVVQTVFGKLGVAICADTYSYKPARVAALEGARLLLIPANWPPVHHNPEKFWRARAAENGIHVLACNRTGKDEFLDCRTAESFIIDAGGGVVEKFSSPKDSIIYGALPLKNGRFISAGAEKMLRRRRPRCYAGISFDTYSSFNPEFLLGLPEPKDFSVATLQFRPVSLEPAANIKKMLDLIDEAVAVAKTEGLGLDLVVLPELSTTGVVYKRAEAESVCEGIPGPSTEVLIRKAKEKNIYIVLGMAEKQSGKFYNSYILLGPDGVAGKYRKIHLAPDDEKWAEAGEGEVPHFDLPFCRVGMLAGGDLMFPEGAESLAKRGADLLCVPALWGDQKRKFIWEARLGEQMHLAIANQWGDSGKFPAMGGSLIHSYSKCSEDRIKIESPAKGDKINILRLSAKNAREKRFMENIDYNILLRG